VQEEHLDGVGTGQVEGSFGDPAGFRRTDRLGHQRTPT